MRARAANGTLLFRNEDLDPQRSRPEFVAAMFEDLAWLGIRWAPSIVTQSERLDLYRAAIHRLITSGYIYPCTCSRSDLARMLHAPHEESPGERDDEPVYLGSCHHRSVTALADPLAHNLRFRTPDRQPIPFLDGNLGPQSFTSGTDFGDFLVWRRDGLPSYQLACVIDDAGMRITEVVRGRDLLKSTARQILLQRALALPTPACFHTPLLADEHGRRLAKRHDALSLRTLRRLGRTPADILAMLP